MRRFHLTFGKLIALIFFGFFLIAAQWKCHLVDGRPIGILIVTPAILLFCIKYPQLPFHCTWIDWIVRRFGFLSTVVYIIHVMVFYTIQTRFPLFAESHPWELPWVVLLSTLAFAIIAERLRALLRSFKKHRKS